MNWWSEKQQHKWSAKQLTLRGKPPTNQSFFSFSRCARRKEDWLDWLCSIAFTLFNQWSLPSFVFIQSKNFWIEWKTPGGKTKQTISLFFVDGPHKPIKEKEIGFVFFSLLFLRSWWAVQLRRGLVFSFKDKWRQRELVGFFSARRESKPISLR